MRNRRASGCCPRGSLAGEASLECCAQVTRARAACRVAHARARTCRMFHDPGVLGRWREERPSNSSRNRRPPRCWWAEALARGASLELNRRPCRCFGRVGALVRERPQNYDPSRWPKLSNPCKRTAAFIHAVWQKNPKF